MKMKLWKAKLHLNLKKKKIEIGKIIQDRQYVNKSKKETRKIIVIKKSGKKLFKSKVNNK